MNLHEYAEKHSQAHIARLLGAAPSFVHQWMRGDRPVPPAMCVLFEQRTNGEVTRKELRTDWQSIWPELAERKAKEAA
jgi:DNA-binding transcriptional regulator YdaS (Cro superfamily)